MSEAHAARARVPTIMPVTNTRAGGCGHWCECSHRTSCRGSGSGPGSSTRLAITAGYSGKPRRRVPGRRSAEGESDDPARDALLGGDQPLADHGRLPAGLGAELAAGSSPGPTSRRARARRSRDSAGAAGRGRASQPASAGGRRAAPDPGPRSPAAARRTGASSATSGRPRPRPDARARCPPRACASRRLPR